MTDRSLDSGAMVDRVAKRSNRGLQQIMGGFSADTVFASERLEDRLVITAAAIERAGGFGFGAGVGVDETETSGGSGGGGGGGGSGQARPVAVIQVGPDGVSVLPVLDYTKIGIVLLTSFITVWRLLRKR